MAVRTLKYAILGLLCREPHTGYDITRAFEQALGAFWSAKHSQIYPELNRLAQEGLVSFEVVVQGQRMEKKLYTVTERGREDFHNWILRDDQLDPTPKDVFKLRVFLSDMLTDDELISHFESQRIKRLAKLEKLHIYADKFSSMLYDGRGQNRAIRADYMVLTGGIMREQNYIDWIDRCLNILRGSGGCKPSEHRAE